MRPNILTCLSVLRTLLFWLSWRLRTLLVSSLSILGEDIVQVEGVAQVLRRCCAVLLILNQINNGCENLL